MTFPFCRFWHAQGSGFPSHVVKGERGQHVENTQFFCCTTNLPPKSIPVITDPFCLIDGLQYSEVLYNFFWWFVCCVVISLTWIELTFSPFVSTKHQPNLKFWCFKFQGCRFWCSRFEISRSLVFMECCEVQNRKWVLWTHLKNRRSVVFFVCAADGWAGVRCTFFGFKLQYHCTFLRRTFL